MTAIPLTRLSGLKKAIVHANCPDGMASAIILSAALPDLEVVFASYDTVETRNLAVEPGMIFCDFSPPKDRWRDFLNAGALVLDHHASVREMVQAFEAAGQGVYSGDPGVGGALLAYQHVWVPLLGEKLLGHSRAAKVFAEDAGIRDTWQKNHPRWEIACEQAASLRFWPAETWLDNPKNSILEYVSDPGYHLNKWSVGPALVKKELGRAKKALRGAYRFEVNGLKVGCFEGVAHTSDATELDTSLDLIIGWVVYCDSEAVPKIQLSCRSRGHFDCSAFTSRLGGGGHKSSAGVLLAYTQEASPHTLIQELVKDYVAEATRPECV